jgi:hypothetical protein
VNLSVYTRITSKDACAVQVQIAQDLESKEETVLLREVGKPPLPYDVFGVVRPSRSASEG